MTLETDLAAFLCQDFVVVTRSGSDAILCSLLAHDIGPQDEVLLPVSICQTVVNMVLLIGAVPVLCDCNAELGLCPKQAGRHLTPRTRAIIAHHPHGLAQHMGPLCRLAEDAGLLFIEDCAQSVGAQRDGQPVGQSGDVAVFSFGTGKTTPLGFGGAIGTADAALQRRLRDIARCGAPGFSDHAALGINSSPSPAETRLFQRRIPSFPDMLARRAEKAKAMARRFAPQFKTLGPYADRPAAPNRLILDLGADTEIGAHALKRAFRSETPRQFHDLVQTAVSPAPFAIEFVNRRLPAPLRDPAGRRFVQWRAIENRYLFLRTCNRHSTEQALKAVDHLMLCASALPQSVGE
jgi:dTDP-4-amino-4,6-dideoxygalactose transaminase